MKTYIVNNRLKKIAPAFTLVELTVVALVGTLIATMSLVLFNTQLASFRIIRTQDFLIHEAPQIHNTLNQIIPRANFFRLYATIEDAEMDTNPVTANASVMVLEFRNNINSVGDNNNENEALSYGIIAIDPNTNTLDYYNRDDLNNLDLSTPDWTISTQITGLTFFVTSGVLSTQITGPNGAQITHSTTTQR